VAAWHAQRCRNPGDVAREALEQFWNAEAHVDPTPAR
jgi:hypothetical protein